VLAKLVLAVKLGTKNDGIPHGARRRREAKLDDFQATVAVHGRANNVPTPNLTRGAQPIGGVVHVRVVPAFSIPHMDCAISGALVLHFGYMLIIGIKPTPCGVEDVVHTDNAQAAF
jgi:hypothetical protein